MTDFQQLATVVNRLELDMRLLRMEMMSIRDRQMSDKLRDLEEGRRERSHGKQDKQCKTVPEMALKIDRQERMRACFAADAMSALLRLGATLPAEEVARRAVSYADSLLAELLKEYDERESG